MRRANTVLGGCFLALGVYLLISAWRFPAGMGRLPGPGFFPAVLGAVIVALSVALLAGARRAEGPGWKLENKAALAMTVALLAGFLLLWGVIPFVVRGFLFVALFLRFLGQPWKVALAAGAVLTAAVVLAFQYGLRVTLG